MKLKIFSVLVLCLLLAGLSTAQEIAFEQKVRLIETFDEGQDVMDPYASPQLAAQDKQRAVLLTTYIIVNKGGKYELENSFKLSEVDWVSFNCQVLSLVKTKAKIHLFLLGPGSGVSIYPGEENKFKKNSLYEVSFTLEGSTPLKTGTYKAFVILELQQKGSAVGAREEMTFRIY